MRRDSQQSHSVQVGPWKRFLQPQSGRRKQNCWAQQVLVQGSAGLIEPSGLLAYFDRQHNACIWLSRQGRGQAYTSATAEHQRAQQSTELQTQTSVRSGTQTTMTLGQGKTHATSLCWAQRCRTAAASHFQLHFSCWSWPTSCIGEAQ
jgi:hypothetical protein